MRSLAIALTGMTMSLLSFTLSAEAADFRFEDYFRGKTEATGSFKAINGVNRKFEVDLTGQWDGRTLTLREDFKFDDGTRDRKTWRFTKTSPTTYTGTREDVVGETKATLSGNKARFTYLVYLDPAKKANKVRFHDTMTLKPDGTVVNTALVTKFGLPVALTRVEFRRGGKS